MTRVDCAFEAQKNVLVFSQNIFLSADANLFACSASSLDIIRNQNNVFGSSDPPVFDLLKYCLLFTEQCQLNSGGCIAKSSDAMPNLNRAGKQFRCSICKKWYANQHSVNAHITVVHKVGFFLEFALSLFKKFSSLKSRSTRQLV